MISIYVDTHIEKPDRLENPIRFKNLVKEAQASLKTRNSKVLKISFRCLKKWRKMRCSGRVPPKAWPFWGMKKSALFISCRSTLKAWRLCQTVFYINPATQFQSNGHYHVLGLNRDNFVLFEADRYGITEIPVDARDATMEGVLGTEKTAPSVSGQHRWRSVDVSRSWRGQG